MFPFAPDKKSMGAGKPATSQARTGAKPNPFAGKAKAKAAPKAKAPAKKPASRGC